MADQFNVLDRPIVTTGMLVTGEETAPRRYCVSNTVASGTSQQLRMTYFRARKSETITQFRVITGGTAAAATPTLCRMGLYSVDETSGVNTLVASTPNDTTLFAATNTRYTKATSASYAKQAGVLYGFGILIVSAAAMPTFEGIISSINTAEAGLPDRVGGFLAAQADLPATFNLSGLTDSAQVFYAAVLP
jgi:hypothetical protein